MAREVSPRSCCAAYMVLISVRLGRECDRFLAFQVLNWSPVAQGKYTMLDGAGMNVRYDAQIPFTFLPAYDTYPLPLVSYVDKDRKLDISALL